MCVCVCPVSAGAAAPGRPGLHPQHGLFALPGRQVRGGLQDVHLGTAADGISTMYVAAAQLSSLVLMLGHQCSPRVSRVSLSAALSYNIALCHYSLKNYNQAVKYIEEIIERGIREHPGAAAL